MAALTTNGYGFRHANTFWKDPRVYFNMQILSGKILESTFICIKPQVHIMSETTIIIILVQRPFFANGAATPYFGPLGHVSC
jgi:hypothetical protein